MPLTLTLDIPNECLRKLKEKTLRYKFKIVYVPSVKHMTADATSKYPSGPSDTRNFWRCQITPVKANPNLTL